MARTKDTGRDLSEQSCCANLLCNNSVVIAGQNHEKLRRIAMTKAELAQHDGRDGRPAYVAVNGTIYDVTASPLWQGGNHQGSHQAGQDLTEELKSAPHVRAVVERFPVVGRLEEPAPQKVVTPGKGILLAIITAAILLLAVLLFR
jgi:predicted heme/steroid binding protein